jgi:uncharacterized metal-binding protein YceD (DUF177 family)
MMIIDIRKLNALKKYAGSMQMEYATDTSLIGIPFVEFVAPVKVEFSYELYEDDSLEIFGKVKFALKGKCSRCLKDAKQDVEGDLEAYFQPIKDAEDYSYTGGKVDLTKAVEDAIMACMPYTISCGEDCQSLSYKG